jgi:hypothetical protein
LIEGTFLAASFFLPIGLKGGATSFLPFFGRAPQLASATDEGGRSDDLAVNKRHKQSKSSEDARNAPKHSFR